MKLIIDIPKKNFVKDDLIRFFGCYSQKLDEVIKNGIPLDDVKAEIAEKIKAEINERLWEDDAERVFEIIDKHMAERSE